MGDVDESSTSVVKVQVKLRGAAQAVMKNRGRQVLLAGPAGTGKSFAALYKVHMMCLANPGMAGLLLRKTRKSLAETGLVTFKKQVAKEAIEAGLLKWYGGSGEKPAAYMYSNGSTLVVGGLDDPDKIMSAEYDLIYIQEATDVTPDDWEKCTTRLRNGVVSFQQLLADCNPQQRRHWLKVRCDEGKTQMLKSHHEDNPRLFDDDGQVTEFGAGYIQTLDELTGARRERLRFGRWASAEGLVYEGWDPDVHLIDRASVASQVTGRLPLAWRRTWAVDFGYTNPFVWQQWAHDPDGRMYLEHEIYRTQTLVEDHAKAILDVVSVEKIDGKGGGTRGANERVWMYPKPHAIICDHDAEDRATLERHLGLGTVPAIKTVSDGIQAVQARMKVQGDGRARLMIVRDSLVSRDQKVAERGLPLGLADEIEGYVWEPAADGKIDKDRPMKINDHSCDAERYAVAYEDLQAKPRIRWLG